jgi:hypothetical protein
MDLLQQVAFEAEHCWTSNVQSFLSERHIVMNIPIAMPKERGERQKLQSIPVYEVVGRLVGALLHHEKPKSGCGCGPLWRVNALSSKIWVFFLLQISATDTQLVRQHS